VPCHFRCALEIEEKAYPRLNTILALCLNVLLFGLKEAQVIAIGTFMLCIPLLIYLLKRPSPEVAIEAHSENCPDLIRIGLYPLAKGNKMDLVIFGADSEVDTNSVKETRQERRGRRLRKKREKMPQHGRSLVRVYKDAVLKRLKSPGTSEK
jgi:hypothetical protein